MSATTFGGKKLKVKSGIDLIETGNSMESNSVVLKKDVVPKPPNNPKSSLNAHLIAQVKNFKPYKSTRPALLEELNAMLDAKLNKDAISEEARMHNFQVYREAFQRFIEEFNIYKQFLTTIKHEYDAHIEKFAYEIRTVTSLRTELATKEQEYSMILKNIERSEEAKVQEIENEKLNLQKQYKDQGKALKKLEADNLRYKAAATKAIKDFEELRVTCATLTNSLSRLEHERRGTQVKETAKQNEFIALKQTAQKSLDEVDRLRHIIHDLEAAQSQMVHQDVVAEHQVMIDMLKADIKSKDTVHKGLIFRYSLLKQTIDTAWAANVSNAKEKAAKYAKEAANAKDDSEEAVQKLNELSAATASNPRILIEALLSQIIELQKTSENNNPGSTATGSFGSGFENSNLDGVPYLDEDQYCTPYTHFIGMGYDDNNPAIPGASLNNHHKGHHGQMHPHTGASSNHSNALFSPVAAAGNTTIAGGAGGTEPHHHEHSHLTPEGIPKYLQYEGRIQHMFLTKWETETIVNEIWDAKDEADNRLVKPAESNGFAHDFDPDIEQDTAFADFYWKFIEEKLNHNTAKAVSFSYNFVDALKKYSYDSDCKIFLLVMQGLLAEHIRSEQIKLIENIQTELIREESLHHNELTYSLPVASFNKTIRKLLSHKNDQSFIRLEKALTLENKGNQTVHYLKLLGEDESGNQGHYCEMVRSQHLQESINFSEHLINMILHARPNHHTNELTLNVIREAIMRADPNKPRNDVNRYLARGCHATVEDTLLMEAKETPVLLSTFIRRLRRGVLFPSGVPTSNRGKSL